MLNKYGIINNKRKSKMSIEVLNNNEPKLLDEHMIPKQQQQKTKPKPNIKIVPIVEKKIDSTKRKEPTKKYSYHGSLRKLPFRRLVREIANEASASKDGMRFTNGALDLIQEIAELYSVNYFKQVQYVAEQTQNETILPKHSTIVRGLLGMNVKELALSSGTLKELLRDRKKRARGGKFSVSEILHQLDEEAPIIHHRHSRKRKIKKIPVPPVSK